MPFRFGDGDGFSQHISSAHEETDFQFVIERLRRRKSWRRIAIAGLAARTADFCCRRNQRRRTPVITNGNVFVIRQQRIVGAKQLSYIGGVEDRGVEVGVVADHRRQKHINLSLTDEMTGSNPPIGVRRVLAQDRMNLPSQGTPRTGSQRHQRLERARSARAGRESDTLGGNETFTLHSAEIENAVADCHSYARFAARTAPPKNSEGQILKRKIRAGDVRGLNPTLHRRIVSLVQDGFHRRRRYRRSSMGSVKEQEPNEIAKSWRAAAISRTLSRSSRQLTPSSSKWNACGDRSSSN